MICEERARLETFETSRRAESSPGSAPGEKLKEIWFDTYDVDYLHEREAKAQL